MLTINNHGERRAKSGHNMIRNSAIIFLVSVVFAACASPKQQRQTQTFSPAQFIVTDVTVGVEAYPKPERSFIRLAQSAAENLRQAYNREVINSAGVYTLEVSLQDVNITETGGLLEPITSNTITLLATVRHPNSGIAMREFPVTYSLVRESDRGTKEEQLLRGALPAAFNGIYGMELTPMAVQSVVQSNQIFDGIQQETVVSAKPSATVSSSSQNRAPSANVSTSSGNTGEPTVIECAIC